MKMQEIFNAGVLGIVAQNSLSKASDNFCYYRSPQGHKCALGHSISDEDYDPEFETKAPILYPSQQSEDDAAFRLAKLLGASTAGEANLLREFQNTHDGALTVDHFLERAKRFAKANYLEFPDVTRHR